MWSVVLVSRGRGGVIVQKQGPENDADDRTCKADDYDDEKHADESPVRSQHNRVVMVTGRMETGFLLAVGVRRRRLN